MTSKPFYQSKTFWTNLVGGALSLLSLSDVTSLLPAKYAPFIVAVVAVLNVVLRAMQSDAQGALTLTNKQ